MKISLHDITPKPIVSTPYFCLPFTFWKSSELFELNNRDIAACAFVFAFIKYFSQIRKKNGGFTSISIKFLRKICNFERPSVLFRFMEKQGWIIINRHFIRGKKSRQYKLSPQIESEDWEPMTYDEFLIRLQAVKPVKSKCRNNNWAKFHNSIVTWRDLPEEDEMREIGAQTEEYLKDLEIDNSDGGLEEEIKVLSAESQKENEIENKENNDRIIKKNKTRALRGWKERPLEELNTTQESIAWYYTDSIEGIADLSRHYAHFHSESPYGEGTWRLFTNLTNLKSEIRRRARYKKQKLVNCDISCAQVCLLSCFYNDSETHQKEKQKFIDFVLNYDFYTEIGKASAIPLTRKQAKIQSFVLMFARISTCLRTPFFKTFESLFPLLTKEINLIKKPDYRRLAYFCQKNEASIVVKGCLLELCRKKIVAFSIHDSILCLPQDLDTVKECITRHFEAVTGFKPKLKVD